MRSVTVFALLAALLSLTPCSHASTFTDGEFVTYVWRYDPPAVSLLSNNYDNVYLPSSDLLKIGSPSPGYSITFTNPDAVHAFLSSDNVNESTDTFNQGVFTVDLLDPTSSSGGELAVDTLNLALDIDFSNAGLLPGGFGDLTFTNLEGISSSEGISMCCEWGTLDVSTLAVFDGMTIDQLLSIEEQRLGGGDDGHTDHGVPLQDLDFLTQLTSTAFDDGGVFPFAAYHLVAPDTGGGGGQPPTPTPEPSALILLGTGLAGAGALRLRRARA